MSKVEDLLAKHPNLTEEDALKIVIEKNARKKQRRKEAAARLEAKELKNEANRPKPEAQEPEENDEL